QVYDAETMAFLTAWDVPRAGQMALDPHGLLWVVQGGSATAAPRVLGLDPDSGDLRTAVTFAPGARPYGLGFDAAHHRLLVTDVGPDQDVKIYALTHLSGSPTTVAATFGVPGGVFAGSGSQIGRVGPLRFDNPVGVGVDAAGNLYVASDPGRGGGGAVVESY